MRASQPWHQCCREVSSFLVILSAAACNRRSGKASACVLRGRMQGGEQDGANGSSHPPSQDADRGPGGTDPTLKRCWLLPLQGLDHLPSPAEGGEAGEDLTGAASDSREAREKNKIAFPFPHSATKAGETLSRSQNRTLLCEPAGRRGLVEMVFIRQRLRKRLSGPAVCLCASCR